MAQPMNEQINCAESLLRKALALNAKSVIKNQEVKHKREAAKWMGGNVTVMSSPEIIYSVPVTLTKNRQS